MNITINTTDPNASITINLKSVKSTAMTEAMENNLSGNGMLETAIAESKQDDELEMDYSECEGFDENFMGFKTPFPLPGRQLKRKLAALTVDPKAYILNYYHFSTMHHTVRKMPVISAINIDGNPAKRTDEDARKDKWMRDNRIDFDVQLTDGFYKKSNFDKGHLARREDAHWGKSAEEAYRDAQMTCMYTNACPQVPDLNRAVYGYHGLWGQLEQIVLEQGVENESGKTTRICVYNGPIFVSTDPVFKGVQIPLRFFKIIVWMNEAGEKKTTAFILSQEDLVGDIQFEELQYDEEFKEHQCNIRYLESLTDLTFSGIGEWDTFVDDPAHNKGVKRIKRSTLEEMLAENNQKINGKVAQKL